MQQVHICVGTGGTHGYMNVWAAATAGTTAAGE
jgi:hypothetical protein